MGRADYALGLSTSLWVSPLIAQSLDLGVWLWALMSPLWSTACTQARAQCPETEPLLLGPQRGSSNTPADLTRMSAPSSYAQNPEQLTDPARPRL